MPDGALSGLFRTLSGLGDELAGLAAPAEAVCLGIGQALGDTVSDLQRIEAGFAELSEKLGGSEALAAVQGIDDAVSLVAGLGSGQGGAHAALATLADKGAELAKRLTTLRQVTGEVSILGINAKIQASQLTTGAADFAVFTNEMARLAILAKTTVDRAAARVADLIGTVDRARAAEEAFALSSGAELTEIRDRLTRGGQVLAERRHRASEAAVAVGESSREKDPNRTDRTNRLQLPLLPARSPPRDGLQRDRQHRPASVQRYHQPADRTCEESAGGLARRSGERER